MYVKNENMYVNVRLPKKVVEKIDKLVQNGNFINRSAFIRYAITVVLSQYDLQ